MDKSKLLVLSICSSFFAIAMLVFVLEGRPGYAFFGPLKFIVGDSSFLAAYICFVRSVWLTPLSLALAATGYVELSYSMRREQWLPWNRASIALLSLAIIIAWIESVRLARISRSKQEREGPRARKERRGSIGV